MDNFELLMLCENLYDKNETSENKKAKIITYAKWLHEKFSRPLVEADFNVIGRVSMGAINYWFGNFGKFLDAAKIPRKRRKDNMSNEELRNYLEQIKEENANGCWTTTKYKSKSKDGRTKISINIDGKKILSPLHRVSYIVFYGRIPDDKIVMHLCDYPPCFNPKHLKLGTQSDNMQDAASKGRVKCGTQSKQHKITDPYNYKEILKFIQETSIITEKDEWIVSRGLSIDGYPQITIKGKKYYLHKLVLANKLTKKYSEIEVARHCLPDGSKPNPSDVNPDHLFEGSRMDNKYDTILYSKSFKITIEDVKQIRKAVEETDFTTTGSKTAFDRKWAAIKNISVGMIKQIRLGRRWKILPDNQPQIKHNIRD